MWAALSLAPMAGYAQPLWQNALADTPVADLVWIPLLATVWGVWNLGSMTERYADDGEVNLLLGSLLLLAAGFLLAVGVARWPVTFVYDHTGLLIWPLWALGLAWLFFGIGVTPRLLGPLAYLLLVWPPIFNPIVHVTQRVLTHWAVAALGLAAVHISWLRPAAPSGNFIILHAGTWYGVVIAQACSGADSLLGAAVLLPLLLTLFRGRPWAHAASVVGALLGALVINWLRLFFLVGSLHWWGPGITFNVLHPALGFLLFALLAVALAAAASLLGLKPRRWPRVTTLRLPGRVRALTGLVVSAALFVVLLPLFRLPLGTLANPLPVASAQPSALLPPVPGFHASVVYRFNESSVLGDGAYTIAKEYVNQVGAFAVVEVWSTPDHNALLSYSFDNCLVYHGNDILARRALTLGNGLPIVAYAISLPPDFVGGPRLNYVDLEWQMAVKTPAGVRYLRWSVAAFPGALYGWPATRLRMSPLAGLEAVSVPPSEGVWPSALQPTRTQLEHFAVAVMDQFQQHMATHT
jgi:exosortase/archaeosortase family protein